MPAHPDDDDVSASPPPAPDLEATLREAEDHALRLSGLGSGLMAQQPTPEASESVAVLKVCPQCGTEYETAARFCPADGTSLRPKGSDTLVGRILADRYHILKKIGEGGMGRVYLGEHVKMNRQCAIKVMSPALVNDHESAARFAREASNAARIIHPNVAAVFDYGESEGLVYLVMEYVEGEPLSRVLAREAPLTVERSLEIARQIADGLGAAHELGIIHRDLKPDNILVSRKAGGREVAKVVDFGIAKAVQDSAGEALTRTGLVIGTPEFMSPEQLLGDPIDIRSDLYALGCILHLMLTAAPPFVAPTREQMIKRRLAEEPPKVRLLDPGLPDSLERVVEKLLARTPGERYGSAAEVRDALSGSHARHPGIATPSGPGRMTPRSLPTVGFERASMMTTEVTPSAMSPARRRRGLALLGGAVAIVGAALALRSARSTSLPATPVATVARADSTRRADSARARTASDSVTRAAALAATTPVSRKDSVAAAKAAAVKAKAAPVGRDSASLASAAVADSTRRAARLARLAHRQRDSVSRAEGAVPATVRAPLQAYARSIESADVKKMLAAYPAMSGDQQKFWQERVFLPADHIRATVQFGKLTQTKEGADADFRIRLNFVYKSSGERGSMVLPQHASLARRGDQWLLMSVR